LKRRLIFWCTLHDDDDGGISRASGTNLSVIKEASLVIILNIQLQIWKKSSTNS